MRGYLQLLIMVTIGISFLWFGYTLFTGQMPKIRQLWRNRLGKLGDVKAKSYCPVCSSRLDREFLVKTIVYPNNVYPSETGRDKLMHIHGCMFCIEGQIARTCPVCGGSLREDGILIARKFDRPGKRPHVHILGCTSCRRMGLM